MKPTLFATLLVLLFTMVTGLAQIRVIEARYGAFDRSRDVTDRVRKIVDRGRTKFEVSNDNLGGDAAKGLRKTLNIIYTSRGKTYRESAREGEIFRFAETNLPVVIAPPPPRFDPYAPWNYSSLPPASGQSVLKFYNESRDPVSLYILDRYGRWYWAASLSSGQKATYFSQLDQKWVITDRLGRVLQSITTRSGETNVRIQYR